MALTKCSKYTFSLTALWMSMHACRTQKLTAPHKGRLLVPPLHYLNTQSELPETTGTYLYQIREAAGKEKTKSLQTFSSE